MCSTRLIRVSAAQFACLKPNLLSPYRGLTRHAGRAERKLMLSPEELATLATIVVRCPGLASTVHAQVRRLIETAASDGNCADQ
jgi:hypothetical protein